MSLLTVASSYPLLAAVVLAGALGLPLPLSVALAAAGVLARQGHLHISTIFLVCVAAAVLGDCLGYWAGRAGRRLCPPVRLPARLRSAVVAGSGWSIHMGWLIFLTRWTLTAPAPAVNALAGARRYPFRGFLIADVTGEALWSATALAPGFLLGGLSHAAMPLALVVGALLTVAGVALAPWLRTSVVPAAALAADLRSAGV